MASIKKGLGSKGKGLEALINTKMMSYNENDLEYEGILEIDINKIEANKNQPRKYFDEGNTSFFPGCRNEISPPQGIDTLLLALLLLLNRNWTRPPQGTKKAHTNEETIRKCRTEKGL